MATAKVKIAVNPQDFTGIAALASTVILGISTHPLNFPAPVPPLATLIADLASLNAAITAWGTVGNRGSHADWLALVAAATLMRNDLLTEGAYVESLVNPADNYLAQSAFIVTSGFSVKNLPSPQGVLGPPQNLHRFMSNTINENDCKLKWKSPLGLTSPGNVKVYKIMSGGIQISTSTKTSVILTGLIHGTNYTFTVVANNDAGDGAVSMPLIVNF